MIIETPAIDDTVGCERTGETAAGAHVVDIWTDRCRLNFTKAGVDWLVTRNPVTELSDLVAPPAGHFAGCAMAQVKFPPRASFVTDTTAGTSTGRSTLSLGGNPS